MSDGLRLVLGLLGWVLLAAGIALTLLGCIGLIRMPDVYTRLGTAAKCAGLGASLALLGTAALAGGALGAKAALAALLLLAAGPTALHALARAAHRSGVRQWEGASGDAYLEDRSRRKEG
ncbi:MAG TPA: monovalent cation/H(+) antiporter subunit G [Planctomycetota bacterium]|nr:monovalent cation/H(+) antiporter subunit G [Planctomycetota bacterium]